MVVMSFKKKVYADNMKSLVEALTNLVTVELTP